MEHKVYRTFDHENYRKYTDGMNRAYTSCDTQLAMDLLNSGFLDIFNIHFIPGTDIVYSDTIPDELVNHWVTFNVQGVSDALKNNKGNNRGKVFIEWKRK